MLSTSLSSASSGMLASCSKTGCLHMAGSMTTSAHPYNCMSREEKDLSFLNYSEKNPRKELWFPGLGPITLFREEGPSNWSTWVTYPSCVHESRFRYYKKGMNHIDESTGWTVSWVITPIYFPYIFVMNKMISRGRLWVGQKRINLGEENWYSLNTHMCYIIL